jgi:hypothetical protein
MTSFGNLPSSILWTCPYHWSCLVLIIIIIIIIIRSGSRNPVRRVYPCPSWPAPRPIRPPVPAVVPRIKTTGSWRSPLTPF